MYSRNLILNATIKIPHINLILVYQIYYIRLCIKNFYTSTLSTHTLPAKSAIQ